MFRRNSAVLRELSLSHTHTNIHNSLRQVAIAMSVMWWRCPHGGKWYFCTAAVKQFGTVWLAVCVTVVPTWQAVQCCQSSIILFVLDRPPMWGLSDTRLLVTSHLARVFLVLYAPCALKQNTVRERRRSPWKRHTRDLWYVCSKIWYQLQRIAGAGGSRERARALSAGGRTSAQKHIVCLERLAKAAALEDQCKLWMYWFI